MRQPPKLKLSVLAALAVALAGIGAAPSPVAAQDASGLGGVRFFVTPYLWLAGINSTIETPLPRAPTVNSDVSAIDLLSHLSAVPFMGSLEIRDGPLGLLGDALHVPVSADITTRNVFFQGGKAALITNTGTALLLYRALDIPGQYADLGGGFRAWGFHLEPDLEPRDHSRSECHPLGRLGRPAVRRTLPYRPPQRVRPHCLWRCRRLWRWRHSDWQLIGTVDYTPTPWIDLHLGYRSLNFDYTASGGLTLGFDVHMKGPILAATFRF